MTDAEFEFPPKPYARRELHGRIVWVGGQAGDDLPRLPHLWPDSWPDVRWLLREDVERLLKGEPWLETDASS